MRLSSSSAARPRKAGLQGVRAIRRTISSRTSRRFVAIRGGVRGWSRLGTPSVELRTRFAQHQCTDVSGNVLYCRMGGGAETKGQRTKTADRETGHVQRSVIFESCRGHTYKTSLEEV